MNVEHIIQAAKEYSEQHFRNGEQDKSDRLTYEIEALRSKLREFSYLIQQQKVIIDNFNEKLQTKVN
jgi:hypothetical protein